MAVTSSKKFFNEKSCLTSNKVQVINARPLNVLVTVSVEAGTRDNLSSEKTSVISVYFNPLHLNISIYILHTVLCTLTKVLTWRICLTIKSFVSW